MTKFENRFTVTDDRTRAFLRYQMLTSPKKIVILCLMLCFFVFGILGTVFSGDLRFAVCIAVPVFFFIFTFVRYRRTLKKTLDAQHHNTEGKDYETRVTVDEHGIEIMNMQKKTTATVLNRFIESVGKTNRFVYVTLYNNATVLLDRDGFTVGDAKSFYADMKAIARKNAEGQKAARAVKKKKDAEQKKAAQGEKKD